MFVSCVSSAVILVRSEPSNSQAAVVNLTLNSSSTDLPNPAADSDLSSIVAVVFVLLFVVFFQFGAGPIPPFITSEMFQSSIR